MVLLMFYISTISREEDGIDMFTQGNFNLFIESQTELYWEEI